MTGRRGRLLLGALLAVVLLAWFFRGIDWSALGQALREARPLPLAGLVLVTIGVYSVRAWRWGDLLAPLGDRMLAAPHPMVPGTEDTDYYRGAVTGPVAEQVEWVTEHRPDDPTVTTARTAARTEGTAR